MKTKPKRRLLRFSLRAMLVVLTVFGVWLGVQVNRANKQRAVVRWVTENGGAVGYHWQWSEYGNKTEPDWLRQQIGDDYFRSVVEVNLDHTNVHKVSPLAELGELKLLLLRDTQVKDLSPLARMTKLEDLGLRGTTVSDLSPLSNLSSLKYLSIDGNQVDDLTPLVGLSRLENLYIKGTQVTDEQISELQKALPNCVISR